MLTEPCAEEASFGERVQRICRGTESRAPPSTAEQQVRPLCEVSTWYSLVLGSRQPVPGLQHDYAQQFIYSTK